MNMAYKTRSRRKMRDWLRDISKNRQLKNKFLAQKEKMKQVYWTVVSFCNNQKARPLIVKEALKKEKAVRMQKAIAGKKRKV